MLLNDFYEILELNDTNGKLTVSIKLNAEHSIYAAHFPGNPITPGVVQIQMVKEILEKRYEKNLATVSINNCKFLKILNPIETPVFSIIITPTLLDEIVKVTAIGTHDGAVYFKLTSSYK